MATIVNKHADPRFKGLGEAIGKGISDGIDSARKKRALENLLDTASSDDDLTVEQIFGQTMDIIPDNPGQAYQLAGSIFNSRETRKAKQNYREIKDSLAADTDDPVTKRLIETADTPEELNTFAQLSRNIQPEYTQVKLTNDQGRVRTIRVPKKVDNVEEWISNNRPDLSAKGFTLEDRTLELQTQAELKTIAAKGAEDRKTASYKASLDAAGGSKGVVSKGASVDEAMGFLKHHGIDVNADNTQRAMYVNSSASIAERNAVLDDIQQIDDETGDRTFKGAINKVVGPKALEGGALVQYNMPTATPGAAQVHALGQARSWAGQLKFLSSAEVDDILTEDGSGNIVINEAKTKEILEKNYGFTDEDFNELNTFRRRDGLNPIKF